ncbi:hypothetical protein BDEG_25445 [Batrachochytrium dendrobatidis JEL423]|uniref:NAD(+) diphosphatase n=1 Tax=Batrachochytrium dendrobatidis (strain JEL423) TaxID=403673 RepID=A0A177WQ21_BATDL|nr:hypothetical protein BDEG_25445 [Batrachochytrium dendrobatidis JEL423]
MIMDRSTDSIRITFIPGILPLMWFKNSIWRAGFMEPGESIDEACKREVFEETNVLLRDVRFHSSQPWPFPSQLMLGCIGVASKENIIIHDGELEGTLC